MPEDYVETMRAVTPLWVLFLMIAATFAVAFLGAHIGNSIIKKHLKKSGMV